MPLYSLRRLPLLRLPPFPSAALSERMLWAGSKAKVFAAAGLAVAGFLNASDFVVNVVVGVATVEHNSNKGRLKVVFQTTLMLINNRIIKEPIFQTASKKVLRSSEKRKPCECVPHTHPASGLKILCKLRLATLGLKVLCGATAC